MESVSKSKKDDIVVLKIKGGIHHIDTPSFEKELVSVIEERNYKIVLDLTQTEYLCSSSLGVLISLERKIKRKGGDIRLVIIKAEILKVLQITLLNKVFRIFSSLEEAIKSFNEGNV